MAQLNASNENEDIICAGPIYPMTDRGGHLDSNGYRWYGEILGKVYYKTCILGEEFKPLQPIEIIRNPEKSNEISIRFLVPKLPLVIDSRLVESQKNSGFVLYQQRHRANPYRHIHKRRLRNTDQCFSSNWKSRSILCHTKNQRPWKFTGQR